MLSEAHLSVFYVFGRGLEGTRFRQPKLFTGPGGTGSPIYTYAICPGGSARLNCLILRLWGTGSGREDQRRTLRVWGGGGREGESRELDLMKRFLDRPGFEGS